MNLRFEMTGKEMTIYLVGELDHHSAKGIGEKMDFEIFLKRPESVCIDFAELSFMDSSGLAVVMGRRRICAQIGAELSIGNLHGSIQKVFLMSGIQKYIKVKENCYENKK